MTRRATALKHLRRVDPRLYRATAKHHTSLPKQLVAKRTGAALFESLVGTVISQQLGVAAADTIYARVKKACGGRLTPKMVQKTPTSAFREAGLSGAKTRAIQEIANAVTSGGLNLLSLKKESEAAVAERLLQLWGLGPWSVEMFLMFGLGKSDVFSQGDLGLIRAMEEIYGLPKNAPRPTLLAISEKWSPHRTYAALLLWRSRDTKAG